MSKKTLIKLSCNARTARTLIKLLEQEIRENPLSEKQLQNRQATKKRSEALQKKHRIAKEEKRKKKSIE